MIISRYLMYCHLLVFPIQDILITFLDTLSPTVQERDDCWPNKLTKLVKNIYKAEFFVTIEGWHTFFFSTIYFY